jgi:hypothetical protein
LLAGVLLSVLPVPLVLLGVSEGVGVPDEEPDAPGLDIAEPLDDEDESGAVLDDDDGAGVLIGAALLGVLEVAGVAGVSSFFLQPARAASTTAVANMVFRINIDPPFVVNNVTLTSVR